MTFDMDMDAMRHEVAARYFWDESRDFQYACARQWILLKALRLDQFTFSKLLESLPPNSSEADLVKVRLAAIKSLFSNLPEAGPFIIDQLLAENEEAALKTIDTMALLGEFPEVRSRNGDEQCASKS